MLKRARPALPDGCVSDLSFDGLRTGELPPDAERAIADHVSQCERCRDRQRALDHAFVEIEAQLPPFVPRTSATQPRVTAGARSRRPGSRTMALSALALAACALLGVLPWLAAEHGSEHDTRTKGGPSLSLYVKRGDDVFSWTPGDPVHAGDALRFVVSPRGYAQIAILSRREDGETSLYYPQDAPSLAIDATAVDVALDGAVELDETIRDEQLFAVFCRSPFTTDSLAAELAASGKIAAPPGCEVATLLLSKRRAP